MHTYLLYSICFFTISTPLVAGLGMLMGETFSRKPYPRVC